MSVVYIVRTTVAPEREDEWARWQTEEHIPSLLSLPGYLGVQRFASSEASHCFMNVWRLASADAFGTPDYRAASLTAWFEALRPFYEVTVDFSVESDWGGPHDATDWRDAASMLVVDCAVDDGSGVGGIDGHDLELLEARADVLHVVCLDPLEPAGIRTPRALPPARVVLSYATSLDGSGWAERAGIHRRRYVPLGPYVTSA